MKVSGLTQLMTVGLILMVIGHAGRPTWYWILLPAAAFVVSFTADAVKAGKHGPKVSDL